MASNLQHTPGPWSFEGPKRSIIVWGPEPGQRICFMTSDGPATENARLIASAPTMAARIAELEAALSAATAERERAERAASNVTSETFRYYLAEAENGLCRIPRRVGDDMWFSYMRIVAAREAAEAKAARLKEAITYGAQLDLPAMLEWTADRLVHVHGDSPNVDFVWTLRDRAKRLRAALEP